MQTHDVQNTYLVWLRATCYQPRENQIAFEQSDVHVLYRRPSAFRPEFHTGVAKSWLRLDDATGQVRTAYIQSLWQTLDGQIDPKKTSYKVYWAHIRRNPLLLERGNVG
jgi:hypothetical protein